MHPSGRDPGPLRDARGQDIGLIESLSLGCWVTIGTIVEPIEAALWALPRSLICSLDSLTRERRRSSSTSWEGRSEPRTTARPARCVQESSQAGFAAAAHNVTWRFDGIHVDSMNGVLTMPLLIVSELRRARDAWEFCKRTGSSLYNRLLEDGIMEYLSVQEAFETTVAPSMTKLQEAMARKRQG